MKKLFLALCFWLAYIGAALAQAVVPVQMRNADLTTTNTQNYITTAQAFTAPRTLTIVDRSSLNAFYIQFIDTAGAINSTNTLTIRVADGSLINGAATLVVNSANNYIFFAPNSTGYSANVFPQSGIPGGSSGQVQYNAAGVFGGISGATSNGTALTLVAPILGTPTSGVLTNTTGFPVANLAGAGTGILAALATNAGNAGAPVLFNGGGGTPSSLTLTNATGLPIGGITGLGTNCGTWLATPSSANLRACLTDETGTGVAYFVGGALGTPSSATLTNATGLPIGGIVPNVFTQTVVQKFTASGTYTPTTGMVFAIIECPGGGGAGGGVAGAAGDVFIAGGGGAGGYSRVVVSAASVGVSKVVTIGAGGTPGSVGANNGGNGGDTSVGTLCVGKGGTGGAFTNGSQLGLGGAGGVAGTGDISLPGNNGLPGFYSLVTTIIPSAGAGANGQFGGGAMPLAGAGTGNAAVANTSGGGSGGYVTNAVTTVAGGAGGTGIVVITEFVKS